MRNTLTTLHAAMTIALMGGLLTATIILSTSSAAWAQRQPTSCSGGAQSCKEAVGRVRAGTSVTPSQCDAAAAQCMKTGVFVGPGSGTRWPVAKK
jgi:hypothetical protein